LLRKQEKLLKIKTVILTDEDYLCSSIDYFDIIDIQVPLNDVTTMDNVLKIIHITEDERSVINHLIRNENIDVLELVTTPLPNNGKLVIKRLSKIEDSTDNEE